MYEYTKVPLKELKKLHNDILEKYKKVRKYKEKGELFGILYRIEEEVQWRGYSLKRVFKEVITLE